MFFIFFCAFSWDHQLLATLGSISPPPPHAIYHIDTDTNRAVIKNSRYGNLRRQMFLSQHPMRIPIAPASGRIG